MCVVSPRYVQTMSNRMDTTHCIHFVPLIYKCGLDLVVTDPGLEHKTLTHCGEHLCAVIWYGLVRMYVGRTYTEPPLYDIAEHTNSSTDKSRSYIVCMTELSQPFGSGGMKNLIK